MVESRSIPRVELEAARLAVEWKNLFATELAIAAKQVAQGSDLITTDHYRQAVSTAISRVSQAIRTQSVETSHAQRRVA